MELVLADTNILLYLLDGDETVRNLLNQKKVFISFITEIELLTFKKLIPAERKLIEDLLSDCTILNVNEEIKKKTIEIRTNYKLKIPNAIIAATAKDLKIPLLSADKAGSSPA